MVDFYGFHVGKYTSPMDPMGYWNKPKYSIYRLMYQLANPRSISSQSFVCEPKGHHWSRANALLPYPKQKFMRSLNHNHRQRKYPHYTMILFMYYETYIWIDCSDSIIIKRKKVSAPHKKYTNFPSCLIPQKKICRFSPFSPFSPPFIHHHPPKPFRTAWRKRIAAWIRNLCAMATDPKGSNHSNQGFGPDKTILITRWAPLPVINVGWNNSTFPGQGL